MAEPAWMDTAVLRTCPRCGHRQPDAAECAKCGVVFRKVRSEPPPTPIEPRRPVTPPASPSGGWLGLLLTLAVLGAFLYFRFGKEGSDPAALAGWHEGAAGYQKAVQEARASRKPLAIYFYTDWCGYCRRLERDVLRQAPMRDLLPSVVAVKINPEKGPEEAELGRRYGVGGYPAFFISHPTTGRREPIGNATLAGGVERLRTAEEFARACREAAGR